MEDTIKLFPEDLYGEASLLITTNKAQYYEFEIDNKILKGINKIYLSDNFRISIEDHYFKQDMVYTVKDEDYKLMNLVSTYLFKAQMECLTPYTKLTNNSIFTTYNTGHEISWKIPKDTKCVAINLDVTSQMIETDLIPNLDNMDNVLKSFLLVDKTANKEIRDIAQEILKFDVNSPGLDLFMEAKAHEWLSYIVNASSDKKKLLEISKDDTTQMIQVATYIDDHLREQIPQETLAKVACMSKTNLRNKFKEVFSMTITEYTQRKRMSIAHQLLTQTDMNVKQVAKTVGYTSPSRFSQLFKKYRGSTPSAVIKSDNK